MNQHTPPMQKKKDPRLYMPLIQQPHQQLPIQQQQQSLPYGQNVLSRGPPKIRNLETMHPIVQTYMKTREIQEVQQSKFQTLEEKQLKQQLDLENVESRVPSTWRFCSCINPPEYTFCCICTYRPPTLWARIKIFPCAMANNLVCYLLDNIRACIVQSILWWACIVITLLVLFAWWWSTNLLRLTDVAWNVGQIIKSDIERGILAGSNNTASANDTSTNTFSPTMAPTPPLVG